MTKHRFKSRDFRVQAGQALSLAKISTGPGKELESEEQALTAMADDLAYLQKSQEKLYAEDRQSLIIIFQGMDAAGKDGCIRHVFSGINPQGCVVHSFKAPSEEELEHHYLWRPMRYLPARGKMAIFNRSYYEEVLVVRVHPSFLDRQRLPDVKSIDHLWPLRFKEIKTFEKMLTSHGTQVIKFFLHVSPEEQLKRLAARLKDPDKHWKVNLRDLEERKHWHQYQTAFEEMMAATSTDSAPWYVIPSDAKWYARAVVADLVAQRLETMQVDYPQVPEEQSAKYLALADELTNGDSPAEDSISEGSSNQAVEGLMKSESSKRQKKKDADKKRKKNR